MAEIRRTRQGKPYIFPPDSDKEVLYFRSSKLASILDDSYNLDNYHQRNTAIGIAENPWIAEEVQNVWDGKETLDDLTQEDKAELASLCEIARDKAGENIKSAWGTVVHWFTECIDNGTDWEDEEPPKDVVYASKQYGSSIDEMYELAADDLDAYEAAMNKYGIRRIMSERFCVCDEVKAAGTLDGVYEVAGYDQNVIGDLKTGKVEYSALKFAMQEAIYSRSVLYTLNDDETVNHEPLPNVSQTKGLLIHLPMRQGRCDIFWLDIDYGWKAVEFGTELRKIRNRGKKTMRSIDLPDPLPVPPLPEDVKTIAQLKDFAREYGISLNGATKKDDIRAAITAAEGEIFE